MPGSYSWMHNSAKEKNKSDIYKTIKATLSDRLEIY